MKFEKTDKGFQTTDWTLVSALADDDTAGRNSARDLLITRYWPPVYSWFRMNGHDREKAGELTQAFFAEVVVSRGLLDQACSHRGRLRSLILTALRNFSVDQYRRATAGPPIITLDHEKLEREDNCLPGRSGSLSGDAVFERRWALSLLQEAMRRCEALYCSSGKTSYWKAFEARVLRPSITGNTPPSLGEVAKLFGFTDANHAAVAVHTVKTRSRELLQQVVGETVDDPSERLTEYGRVVEIIESADK